MEIYTRREIARILQGLRMAMVEAERAAPGEPGGYIQGYHDGFGVALVSLALSIGYGTEIKPWKAEGPIWIEGLANE